MRRQCSRLLVVLAFAGLAIPLLAAAPASGHPPGSASASGDWHFSCLRLVGEEAPAPSAAPARVGETLSYVAPLGGALPCAAPDSAEWGSHVRLCHAPPFLGPRAGAYCGPVVPSGLAGGAAVCSWRPLSTSVPTGLAIGFDAPIASISLGDGLIRHSTPGEERVFGPFPPGTWRVPNPLPVMGRVMAYPTNVALPPHAQAGVLVAADASEVVCVAAVG